MKAFLLWFVFSGFLFSQTSSSPSVSPQSVDWSTLNPEMIDASFDVLDASERMASELRASEVVYAPRAEESEKAFQKLKRLADSKADWSLYSSIVLYRYQIGLCRTMLVSAGIWDEAKCSPSSLGDLHDRAEQSIKNARAASRAASPRH